MQNNYEDYYKGYWDESSMSNRDDTNYYSLRYDEIKEKLFSMEGNNVIDVGGGSGQFLKYLGIKDALVFDISESGLELAKKNGYQGISGDLHKRFPVKEDFFDVAYCFEVLEHLNYPSKTLSEINNILKKDGILFIGQPNTPADGVHHVRRYYISELESDLRKTGFVIEWVHFIPGFNQWDSLSVIWTNQSFKNFCKHLVAHCIGFLPKSVRRNLASLMPNRFALMYVLKCRKV